eukprot:3953558-Ditylum_brightwellii.AAC.1
MEMPPPQQMYTQPSFFASPEKYANYQAATKKYHPIAQVVTPQHNAGENNHQGQPENDVRPVPQQAAVSIGCNEQ